MNDAPDVLLVEDVSGDVRLTREALTAAEVPCSLHAVETGTEALSFCRSQGEHADAPTPDLILLDLPVKPTAGRSFLEAFREDDDLRPIPLIVFVGADSTGEILAADDDPVNAVLPKPADPDEFLATIESVATFWLGTARLPDVEP